ncbi:hypothetical protein PCC7418_3562 [Halothece sp. PCC 7418]|uniref:hypothetical protein n=1 Tax=Halothece sp. (strain PCC 7418) TaxID=65093 RepID=UPI0002A07062|nr:hypothetical protein [Halothece sp. PCC 7418]AFZ45672.1 hypothetical protein PCC7418_3562 [Halothece sp. PCC 7418]
MATLLITRWILPGLLMGLWLLIALSNAISLYQARQQKGTTSLTLFLGGIFGIVGVLASPLPQPWFWCWFPPLLDVGSIPALVMMIQSSNDENGASN